VSGRRRRFTSSRLGGCGAARRRSLRSTWPKLRGDARSPGPVFLRDRGKPNPRRPIAERRVASSAARTAKSASTTVLPAPELWQPPGSRRQVGAALSVGAKRQSARRSSTSESYFGPRPRRSPVRSPASKADRHTGIKRRERRRSSRVVSPCTRTQSGRSAAMNPLGRRRAPPWLP